MAKQSPLAWTAENIPSQKVWDATRAQELYGESPGLQARKTLLLNARSILQKLQESIEKHVSIPGLLVYISKRSDLLSDGEIYHLKRQDFSAKQKALLLVNYIASRKKTPVERLYLCLLDSYNEPGMEGHYIVAQQLRNCALREIKQKTAVKDIEELALAIENVPLRPDVTHVLLSLLEVPHAQVVNLPSNLHSMCQLWISSCHGCSLEVLVRALLCTPGLGYLVTGLVSICESNPPEVWRFLEKVGEKWFELAIFMGYKIEHISSLKSQFSSLDDQLHHFLRVWRVPDCRNHTSQILGRLLQSFEVPSSVLMGSNDGEVERNMSHDPVTAGEEKNVVSQSSTEFQELPPSPQLPHASTPAVSGYARTDLNPQPADTDRGLLEACSNKNWELADLLVHPGALECRDKNGRTPLHICCKESQTELVLKLIEYGACITAYNQNGDTCLHLSEVLNNSSMLAVLLDAFICRGITVDQRNRVGMSPLLIACLIGDSCTDGVKALLEAGADPDGNEQAFFRPLTAACAGGHERVVNLLLCQGANINIQDKEGRTPLICACLSFSFDIAKLLMKNEADAKIAGKVATTALHVCADKNAIDVAEVLLDGGANPNRIAVVNDPRNITGTGEVEETPLTCACAKGHLDMVKLLCSHGANVNELCSGIVPPVGFAFIFRQHHIVEYLVEHPRFDRSFAGLAAPIHIAVRCKNYICVPYMLEKCQSCTPAEAILFASEKNLHELQEGIQRYFDANSGQSFEETCMVAMMSDIEEKKNECNRWSSSVHTGEMCLSRLCQIVVNILRYKPNIEIEALADTAKAEGLVSVSSLLLQCLDFSLDPIALKTEFLIGQLSALRFVLQNHLITMEDFYAGVQRYYPDSAEEFCTKLVMTFHEVNGGHELPTDTQSCLKKLLSGGFVPAVSRSQLSGGGECERSGIINDPVAERNVESDGFPGVGQPLSGNGQRNTPERVSTTKANQPTLRLLVEELKLVSEWFTFGTLLGIEQPKLRQIQIEQANYGIRRCIVELCNHWLDTCLNPTWEMVANALDGIEAQREARSVREKYCKCSATQGEGDPSLYQSQSARDTHATRFRPTNTMDNRFVCSTMDEQHPAEEANNLSDSLSTCLPQHPNSKMEEREMPTTTASLLVGEKESFYDHVNLNASENLNSLDIGEKKSENEVLSSVSQPSPATGTNVTYTISDSVKQHTMVGSGRPHVSTGMGGTVPPTSPPKHASQPFQGEMTVNPNLSHDTPVLHSDAPSSSSDSAYDTQSVSSLQTLSSATTSSLKHQMPVRHMRSCEPRIMQSDFFLYDGKDITDTMETIKKFLEQHLKHGQWEGNFTITLNQKQEKQ